MSRGSGLTSILLSNTSLRIILVPVNGPSVDIEETLDLLIGINSFLDRALPDSTLPFFSFKTPSLAYDE